MGRLRPEKLHVRFAKGCISGRPLVPRRYTLTHSDRTGELFLSIGPEYDEEQLRGWQARLMRDEVLAEWQHQPGLPELHVHCHVSGQWALGPARWRDDVFRRELPLALEALCYGDRELMCSSRQLKQAPVWVHFHARQAKLDATEEWGTVSDYLPPCD